MKKKILNGILMVAMLFAATTSFVSCKDNVDDELVPVWNALSQQKDDLQKQIDSYQSQIDALKANDAQQDVAINNLQTTLQNKINELQSQIDVINTQISKQSAAIDEINQEIADIKAQLTLLEANIADLQEAIEGLNGRIDEMTKQITGIEINQTISNVTGTINLPGGMLKLNALAAFYGENVLGITEFPTAKFEENHIYGDNQLTAEEVAPAAGSQYTFFNEGYITQSDNNAGMLFFTVQSLDQDNFDIEEYTLSAQNSLGKTTPITFSDVKPSSYLIQPGIYKSAYVDTDPDLNGDPTFFQARAHIDQKDLEASKFNLNKFIDLKQFINSDFKSMVDEVKAAKGTKAKVTAVAKVVAQKLANIYSGNMSGDNKDITNPSWSAHKLVLSKEVDGQTVKKSALDYNLAVSAVQPLSYNSFWAIENGVKGVVGINAIENVVARLAKAIKRRIPTINTSGINFEKIEIDENAVARKETMWIYEEISEEEYNAAGGWNYPEYVTNWIDEYDENDNYIGGHPAYLKGTEQEVTVTPMIYLYGYTADGIAYTSSISKDGTVYYYVDGKRYLLEEAVYKPIIDAINDGLDLSSLQDLLNQVAGIPTSLGNAVDNLEARFNSYIEKFGNTIVSAMNNHMLTRAVTPLVLYNSSEGISRLVTGLTVKAGTMQINVTSPTEELLVPAYAKYVAVFKDGKAVQAQVVPGGTQRFDLNLSQAGEYKIVVSCMDYFGYIVNKRFNITVQ